jgi:hypothetical protein
MVHEEVQIRDWSKKMGTPRTHTYHAEADVLTADLTLPLKSEVRPQAYVNLPGTGGYLSERAEDFRLESVISFESAYTQVAGNPSDKPNGGWVTLATAVVEGLNVLDVVTADRVVAQISTEHPLDGYVPSVTFLGTRFEGLKIAGVEIHPQIDLNFCAPIEKDHPYLSDAGFRKKVEQHWNSVGDAPADIKKAYSGTMPDPEALEKEWKAYAEGEKPKGQRPGAFITTSLVNSVGVPEDALPWRSYGNALAVPNFGRIFLAELRVECDTFRFSMIRLDMGCVSGGKGTVTTYAVNGGTRP